MRPGAHRLAMQQLNARGDGDPWPTATVTAVTAGGGADGEDLVTVTYLGAELNLPHMDHYTPVVEHVVALVRIGGLWTVFGRPVGFPPPP